MLHSTHKLAIISFFLLIPPSKCDIVVLPRERSSLWPFLHYYFGGFPMRKSITAFTLVILMMVALLSSCTGTTPDVAAKEAILTLDEVNWTIELEGVEATSYTMADAQAHAIDRIIVSMVISVEDTNMASARKSFLAEGITFAEFLADIGATDANKVTFYGTDLYEAEVSYTMTPEDMASEDVRICWIMNKTEVLPDTKTYVGILCSSSYNMEFPSCCSVNKIVIE